VILVAHHRFANQGWRISAKSEGEYRNHDMRKETHFYIRKRFFAYVDDTTKIQFTVYSLLGDPFLSSAGENRGKRHCKHLCRFDLAVAKSNLGRENSAIRLRASNNSSVPGE